MKHRVENKVDTRRGANAQVASETVDVTETPQQRGRRRLRQNKTVDMAELYAMKPGRLWAALKQEPLSLWMLCVYFFFEYVRPQNLYPALDVLPWGQLAMLGALLTAVMDPTSRSTSNVLNRYMVAFALIIILSGITAFRPALSLDYWTVFGTWFIIYFVSTSVVNTEKRLLLFLLAYCLFNLKMSQHGAIEWAMRGFSFASFGLIGSPGWFKNSGEFAIQMLIFGPLALSIVIALHSYWGKYKKLFLFGLAITGYMAVLGASSRGAQLGMLAVGLWFLLKQRNGFKGLLAMIVIGFLLYHFLPDEQLQRFREMGEDENSLQRLTYWKYALDEVIPDNLVLGLGYHNWLAYLNYVVPEGMGPMEINQESHNIFIQATSELGLIGLTGFLLMILYAFISNARTRKMAEKLDNRLLFYLAHGLDAGLVGYLVAGSFVTVLYYPFFWIQVTMIAMLNNVTRKQYQQRFGAEAGNGVKNGRQQLRRRRNPAFDVSLNGAEN